MNNYELYHYGIPGMKWGVRRHTNSDGSLTSSGQKRAERDAKKLAKLTAKEIRKHRIYAERFNVAAGVGALGDRRVKNVLDKTAKEATSAAKKKNKFMNKITNKYKDTPYSDIKVETHKLDGGRTYVAALFGNAGRSPYDGSQRYHVTAGHWDNPDR